jgi:hypothetical protein
MSTIFLLLCQFHFWNDFSRLEASIIEKAVSKILNLCSINSIAVGFGSGPRFQGRFFKSPAVCTEN